MGINRDFMEEYEDLVNDPDMKTIVCTCGTVWFCGIFGEYSPGINDCISPIRSSSHLKMETDNVCNTMVLIKCECGQILSGIVYDKDSNGEVSICDQVTILK